MCNVIACKFLEQDQRITSLEKSVEMLQQTVNLLTEENKRLKEAHPTPIVL